MDIIKLEYVSEKIKCKKANNINNIYGLVFTVTAGIKVFLLHVLTFFFFTQLRKNDKYSRGINRRAESCFG